jgi:serine/threonine-protein kinase
MPAPAPLAGRYHFARSIQAGTNALAWLATDQEFGKQVVACALGEIRLKALERAVGVEHAYLATILDMVQKPTPEVIPAEGLQVAAVAIAEYVPGLTLYDQLRAGALPVSDAVTMIARAAEAVQALHAAGAVHGAISPRSLIIAPSVPRPAPVVAQLVAPTSGAYSTPERLDGGGPTPENDVWALYALLYAALSGVPAFEGASKEELSRNMREQRRKSLAELGVDRPELEALIAEGLAGDPERRRSKLSDLLGGLTAWVKNRDASSAEAAELARLSMDWEDEQLPGAPANPTPQAAPTPVVPEYPLFADEDADVATTVFSPSLILKAAAASLPSEPPPPRPRQHSIFLPDAPLEPAPSSSARPPDPAPKPAPSESSALADPAPPSAPAPSGQLRARSKPPPLPTSSQPPARKEPLLARLKKKGAKKPRHPNKRRATEEKALEDLRPESAPLGNEEQAVIPMFPLEALYDQDPTRLPESLTKPDENPEATEASDTESPRDTGMASRAPPKPQREIDSTTPSPTAKSKTARASKSQPSEQKRETPISSRPEPRRDSKPWHDLTVPSKARQAERAAAAESARPVAPAKKPANPWFWIVGLLGGLTAVAITALELERRNSHGGPATPENQHDLTATASPPPFGSMIASTGGDGSTDAPVQVGPDGAPIGPAALATNPLGVCVASYFPPETFTGAEDFAFLCADTDFRGVTSQLHRVLVVAAAGKVSEGMKEWATLGWYELGVAAIIRIRCCPDAPPINLPSYSSAACKPMPTALAAVGREPMSPGDVPDRAGALAADIRCLYLNGIPRPYHYGVQPSGSNRLTFEAFLTRIAARPH